MLPMRKGLGLLLTALAFVAVARASTTSPPAARQPPAKADGPGLDDAAVRQAQLKRQFGIFKEKLVLLTFRLENSGKAEDREKAKALRKVLAMVHEREVDGKFDRLIRDLARPGADRDADLLARALKDNTELRDALKQMVALMLAGPNPEETREKQDKVEKLLDQLRELRSKQARLLALNEMGRHSPEELRKHQDRIARETDRLLKPLAKKAGASEGDDKLPYDSDPATPAEKKNAIKAAIAGIDDRKAEAKVQEAVEQARRQMETAGDNLAKGNRTGAGDAQGAAVGSLDKAIRELEDLLKQLRKEEIERVLANLKQRCERMLQMQIEVRDGTVTVDRDVQSTSDKQPTVGHRSRANALADREGLIGKEAESALKILQGEGSAVAFAASFQQLLKDARTVQNRLNRADAGKMTVTIENAMIETLKEMIEALKKQMQPPPEGPSGPRPPDDGKQPGKRPLIELLAELKMIYSLQKRVADRTALYGKEYSGEQAPRPGAALTPRQRELYEMIQKELKDLAESQQEIRTITHNIAIAVAARERR